MHRLWKDSFVASIGVPAIVRARQARAERGEGTLAEDPLRFLDVAGGTGDISFRIIEQLDKAGGLHSPSSNHAQPTKSAPIHEKGANNAAVDASAGEVAAAASAVHGDEKDTMTARAPHLETPAATVTISDINAAMLGVGKQRAIDRFSPVVRRVSWMFGIYWSTGCLSCSFDLSLRSLPGARVGGVQRSQRSNAAFCGQHFRRVHHCFRYTYLPLRQMLAQNELHVLYNWHRNFGYSSLEPT